MPVGKFGEDNNMDLEEEAGEGKINQTLFN
jgi:hypothetical protein